MPALILVTSLYQMPTPLSINLGDHMLIITRDYTPDAFELAAPVIDETDNTPKQELVIPDHDETYNLYQCLHTLLFKPERKGDT